MFGFGFAATYYRLLMTDLFRGSRKARTHLSIGNGCLQVGVRLFTLVPALILFIAGLLDVAFLALGLWALLFGIVLSHRVYFESIAKRGPPEGNTT